VTGTFRHQGDREFWDVHDADDPAQTVAAIRQALGTAGAGSEPVASRRAVVEAYVEGFRRSDHKVILACLTDDGEWVLHGYRTLRGKAPISEMSRRRTHDELQLPGSQ
jgi:hypothetical protein